MDLNEKYKQAASEYVAQHELNLHDPDFEQPVLRRTKRPSASGYLGKSSNTNNLSRSQRSGPGEEDNADDLPFDEYLKSQGVKDSTIDILKQEDVTDLSTLGALTDADLNELGLKLGQRAVIRKLSVKSRQNSIQDQENEENVSLEYLCMESEGNCKVLAEIATKQNEEINPVKTRILILVDISGSMGIKTGRKRRYSKLSRIKGFAKYMVSSLDDGDFAGLVTFGENADVLLPMTEISSDSREVLKSKLDNLDKTYLSTKTNLSAGLSKALDVFREAGVRGNDLYDYRNTIIVFSDGEVNAGTQSPNELVREVRDKIRKLSKGLDESVNQWVSISTVMLGKTASECMYCLSKFCSSDAFYAIDMDVDKNNSEIDLFLPVLMRKSAIVWNVSVHVEALNGATIIDGNCSQENKVRSGQTTANGPRTAKAYFFYDIPAASFRHIGIGLDLREARDEEVLQITMDYSTFYGVRKTIIKTLTKTEILQKRDSRHGKAIAEHYKNDARLISEEILSKAAKAALEGNSGKSAANIEKGKSDLQKLMNKYGEMAMAEKEETSNSEIIGYAESLMQNMESLLQAVKPRSSEQSECEEQSQKSWLKIKAVSSAITREAPGMAETVSNGNLLCPLPNTRHSEPMEKACKMVRESWFFNFDEALTGLASSFKENDL